MTRKVLEGKDTIFFFWPKGNWYTLKGDSSIKITSAPFFEGVVWLGEAKVSCILHHQGAHLILTYSWTRPAIFAAVEVERE